MKGRVIAWQGVVISALSIFLMSCNAVKSERKTTDQDFLIVAIGDSYASGQGAPDGTIDPLKGRAQPDWDDRRCNRSLNAGTAQAAETLKNNYAVDFESFACSGATIEKGLIGGYKGSQPRWCEHFRSLSPQMKEVKKIEKKRPIGALTISVGGNDIYFGHIVKACMLPGSVACDLLQPIIDQKLGEFPARYALLAKKIKKLNIEDHRVFLTQYPDPAHDRTPTHDQYGEYCNRKPAFDALRFIDRCEAEWASKYVVATLNWHLCKIAAKNDWIYVDGIADKFSHSGWCADDPSTDDKENWINTVTDSLERQGHFRGAMHPDRRGHAVYGERLAAEIEPLLQGMTPTVKTCGAKPPYIDLAKICL